MPDIQNKHLEAYSEEVQEIMGHVPQWIVRWGISVFFIIFVMIIVGSYLFKHPVVVSAPFELTTINPPASLICKSSGRIAKWYVSDGQDVHPETTIALLENQANYQDIKLLNDVLHNTKGNWIAQNGILRLPNKLLLGTLQNSYINFQNIFNDLYQYLKQDLIRKKMVLLESRISNQKKQYELILKQMVLEQERFDLVKSTFLQDSIAYFQGGYGILKSEYEHSLQTIIDQKSSLLSNEAKVMNVEVSLLQLEESLLDLEMTRENDLNAYKNSLNAAMGSLQTQIDAWFENYVITSPMEGKITLTNYWSENQVVNAGERLATIVPREKTIIIARAFIPSTNLGKVEPGQRVNIKLSGFPYMEYGVLKGLVNSISMIPEDDGYVAEIQLIEGMKSSYSETLKFIQQMDGTADIITGETRLLYRFINPLRALIEN